MPFFSPTDSASLFYIDEQPLVVAESVLAKPPCLLIHGWTCDSLDWSFQIPLLLSRGHRVIAFDARGHGRSSVPPESSPDQLRPEVTADDAAALLSAIGSKTPHIVFGHSSGALTASLVATRHPQLVKALVLIDPIYFSPRADCVGFNEQLAAQPRAFALQVLSQLSYTATTPEWLKTWHRMRVLGNPAWVTREHAYQKELAVDAKGNWEGAQEAFGNGRRAAPRLALFSFPLNVEKEKSLGAQDGDATELVEEGHWMHVQAADKVYKIVDGWLEGILN